MKRRPKGTRLEMFEHNNQEEQSARREGHIIMIISYFFKNLSIIQNLVKLWYHGLYKEQIFDKTIR